MTIDAILILAAFIGLFLFFYLMGRFQLNKNLNQGKTFLASNKTDPKVHATQSGLQYQLLKPAKPRDQFMLAKADSTICVHYEGRLLDGTVFDKNEGKPVTFELNQMIKGWQEGIQLMQIGEKTRFFIPCHLAYGERKVGSIPAGSTLIFDIKLVDFY